MDDEHAAAISQLGGFAVGHLLDDLGVDAEFDTGVQRRLGLGGGTSTFGADQIYKDRFEDDEDVGSIGREQGEDLEDEIDAEMRAERSAKDDIHSERYYRQGMAALSLPRTTREDDDYDEESAEGDHDESRVKQEPSDAATTLLRSALSARASLDDFQAPRSPQKPPSPVASFPPPQQRDIKTLYPGFDKSKVLDFTDLFATRPPKRRKLQHREHHIRARIMPDDHPAPSTKEMLRRPDSQLVPARKSILEGLAGDLTKDERRKVYGSDTDSDTEEMDFISSLGREEDLSVAPRKSLDMMELDDWEDRILWDSKAPSQSAPHLVPYPISISRPPNADLLSSGWLKSIIWDSRNPPSRTFTELCLDMNDPDMMLEPVAEGGGSLMDAEGPAQLGKGAASTAKGIDPFNLSNDRYYEVSKEHRHRVRQTLGQLVVQHAYPAQKLQMPFYKTRLTKSECRAFHRPGLQFPTDKEIHFDKVVSNKKRKGEKRKIARDAGEVLKSTRDLTLKETGNFVLWEYSEEYPTIISNLGMGSLLVNYYRKKDVKDEHIPKLDLGEPFVLDVADESPFMRFGSVEAGQTVPTLYNNLVRAPLFRHQPASTDFLVVRSTVKGQQTYYIREIRNLFAVGQTYPVAQVPGPHSRLVTNTLKHRLQTIAYRLVKKTKGGKIQIRRLFNYFPDQNDLQMRQRLKEFMEYSRNEDRWRLRPHIVVPEDSEMLKLVTPEHICLCESMQVGQRHLLDAGFAKTAHGAGAEAEGDEEGKNDLEQLLAPWITTKNFLNATQSKAMLKLHGEGDPSGRGEAFSFIRVSMKEIFVRAGEDPEAANAEADARQKSGHRYNVAQQQAVYRSEIDRIWNAQYKALSDPVPPELTEEDERRALQLKNLNATSSRGPSSFRASAFRSPSVMSGPSSPGHFDRDASPSRSRMGSVMGGPSNRVLKIRRLVKGRWENEIVRDPAVISAYTRQRQLIEDANTTIDALVPTNDEELNRQRKKLLEGTIAKMKKNKERRMQRKNAKLAAAGEDGAARGPNKTDTTRRCGRCGQVGHMATNTACPMHPGSKKEGSVHGKKAGKPSFVNSSFGINPLAAGTFGTPSGFSSSAPSPGPLSAASPGGTWNMGSGLSAGLDNGGQPFPLPPNPSSQAGSPVFNAAQPAPPPTSMPKLKLNLGKRKAG